MMTTEPARRPLLQLRIVSPPAGSERGVPEVRPVVDGQDLLVDGSSHWRGASPRHLLDPDDRPLHADAVPREVRLAGGGCGVESCCGALYVTVVRDGDEVVWSGWRDPAGPGIRLPELRFDAEPYEAEVRRATADRGWEWPACAVARLLEAALRRREDWLARWECELEAVWAARREPDRIHVVLGHPGIDLEDGRPWLQFGLTLLVDDGDPTEQAGRFEAQLTAADPRAVAEVWGGSADAERLGYPWPPTLGE
ncbi:hypothetical protein [Streptomyces sp. NPDC048623]|uniref:hypothetical protein n=1 Tax=Streptomyces sp. NPDC048623 TaxID=3155761 RepID=UPI003422DB95